MAISASEQSASDLELFGGGQQFDESESESDVLRTLPVNWLFHIQSYTIDMFETLHQS